MAEDPLDNLAPQFVVEVADKDVPADLLRFIQKVEYESADGIADMARLSVSNPDFVISDSTIFQPGNELNIRMGYGDARFIGRVEIARIAPSFPEDGLPTMEVIGYTRDYKMMDNSPEKGSKRVFQVATIADIMDRIAEDYGFFTDVDEFDFGRNITQKAGMSDYDLAKGLANFTGFLFWVDGDENGIWTLHFKDPKVVRTSELQDKQFTFHYGQGELSTLLSFEPELAVRDARTKIKIAIRNPERGRDFIEVIEEEEKATDLKSKAKIDDPLEKPIPTGATIKLFFGDFSLEIVTNKTSFIDASDARAWAEQWFRRQRENFVIGSGELIGIEEVLARQVHTFDGLGVAFNGDYYFTRARHVMDQSKGYRVDFTARRHLP